MPRILQSVSLAIALTVTISTALAEDTQYCFDAIYALKEDRLDNAIALYSRCIDEGELSELNLIVAYNDRGNAYGKSGHYDLALADFNQVITLNPEDPDAYYNRGLTQKRLHVPEQALADYTKAISLNPKYAKAFNNRGSILGEKGLFAKAIEDFDRAISLNPADASSWFNRGLAHYSNGNFNRAVTDLEKAIELNPAYIKAYENLAWLRATCPDESLRNGGLAIALAKKASFLQPEGTSTLYDVFAAAYAAEGSYDRAIQYQQLAIEVSNNAKRTATLKRRLSLYRKGAQYEESTTNRFLVNS